MQVHAIKEPQLSICTYLLIDEISRECAVIDPVRNIGPLIEKMGEYEGLSLKWICQTHIHADFLSGSPELALYWQKTRPQQQPQICCSLEGGQSWLPSYVTKPLKDLEVLKLGQGSLTALHTPGHTPEHMAYLLFDGVKKTHLFTGDLLLIGCVGRPDLLGESSFDQLTGQLYDSLFSKLGDLPDELIVMAAHGAGSLCGKAIIRSDADITLGAQRESNPSLFKKPFEQWRKELLDGMPAAPAYFSVLKRKNLALQPFLQELPDPEVITEPSKLQTLLNSSFLPIDLRPVLAFSQSHLKGSFCVPLSPAFSNWAGALVPYEKPLLLICERVEQAKEALGYMRNIGLDEVKAIAVWEVARKLSLESLKKASKEEFDAAFHLIDVRSPIEWQAYRKERACHIELARLPEAIQRLDQRHHYMVYCASGVRACVGAAYLQSHGFSADFAGLNF